MAHEGVVLFGGSFNPIHNGHLIVARSVAERLGSNRVVLIPSASPPHKNESDLAEAGDRLEMARLAVAEEPGFETSDIEIQRSGPSYTVLTIEAYRKHLGPEVPLYWLIGADTLPELHAWYRVGALVDLCRIVVAARPGFESPDLSQLSSHLSATQIQRLREGVMATPHIDIAATDIRRRLREGLSIRYLVPEPVNEYIIRRKLYRRT